jgi:prepilin-type N-terminal cleavage/methylation domain-containing protein
MRPNPLKQNSGFTLIELIVTIVLAGLVLMMISPFFQSGVTESHRPARRLQDAVALERAMENMTGAYKSTLRDTTALQNLSTNIGTVGSSYNNTFGSYTVVEKGYISFNGGNEQAGGTTVLKVTICSTASPGMQLTQLFTVQVPH